MEEEEEERKPILTNMRRPPASIATRASFYSLFQCLDSHLHLRGLAITVWQNTYNVTYFVTLQISKTKKAILMKSYIV